MHRNFIEFINQYASSILTETEISTIRRIFVPRKVKKRQFFLQAGEVCKNYGFVVKGAMRQYSVDEKGNEHIVQLSVENWWVGDRESFIRQTPSLYFVDAWEETDLLVLKYTDVPFMDEIPALREMKAKLDENHHFALQKRVNASISLSAEQRYELLADMYPAFLQRFPQHIIASYLGVTKETLSRLKGASAKK